LDLGVSSMQIDTPERGFSFQKDGPLDMRMSSVGQTASDIVNTFKEKELADIFFEFGEEKASRRIASKIAEQRKIKPFETTMELARTIHSVMPFKPGQSDTATRTFQALRIYVNNEMGVLDDVLTKAPVLLKKDGRFVVVSFHSLEDRRVKKAFNTLSGNIPSANRYAPPLPQTDAHFELLTKKAVQPSENEIKNNPRSRSSRLRAVRRIS
ncbi:MAG: 16S rRNA (cytosine(1402)-N(4))-methyltransferase RsmH, partial [Alphaproteobacteria bacterium]|nr:16S rRNA (cytosine(1402)-N(4))-methyltransferase RsmH [Alphaproteobacteria bacterium]